jgi:hypothetical protein
VGEETSAAAGPVTREASDLERYGQNGDRWRVYEDGELVKETPTTNNPGPPVAQRTTNDRQGTPPTANSPQAASLSASGSSYQRRVQPLESRSQPEGTQGA